MAKVIFGKAIKWEDADFNWDQAPPDQNRLEIGPYTWDNVLLIIEAVGGGGDMDEMPWTQWGDEEEKKNVFIPDDMKVHHANWASGVPRKLDLLKFIQNKVKERSDG